MNPFHEISAEIDRFYERIGRAPTFVLVGLMEWSSMEQHAEKFPGVEDVRWFVGSPLGKIEVKRHPTYYSMIAPILEKMP